ncbi:hypothetical protein D5086_028047 [Populus alba]|uniref:Uncharacterized protein n=1 Tax=Populus alba TaxID=43335 RepID=A0ACC4AYB1_POPAL
MLVPLFNLAPNLTVSRLCLGTMTFGEQNSLPQSFGLLDEAFNAGINFFDSAEMYPVPQRPETQGRSEEYLGRWIKRRKIPRDRIVLSTKVAGPSGQMTWIRGGPKCLDSRNITDAIDSSLKRMQVDYIDLYQIHWPDRYVPMFGETEYDPTRQFCSVGIEEQLDALGRAVAAGKIRYIGVSNETPYGVMKFSQVADRAAHYPKIVSVQNSYNLLCRTFDAGIAECCHHEGISLLAYSPLAMGILSGKYFAADGGPVDARLNVFKGMYSEGESRYNLSNNIIKAAALEYLAIAKKYGLHPVSLSIAFVLKHPLVASAIFGATKSWQLHETLRISVLDRCFVFLLVDAATKNEKIELRCNIMGRSEFCEIKGDIRIDGNSSTAFIVSSETDILTAENTSWIIRPYARKEALEEKDFARKWSVKLVTDRPDIARCTRNHSVPAILFSVGGYSGNFFHAFTDILVPLYSTAQPFNREVQFLITNRKPRWIAKFKTLLEALSGYEIIDIDDRHDIHCFQSLTIGLKESLSYQVIVAEPGSDVLGFAKIINSCDVVMGVHGAGLTNMVFLPENAILIQGWLAFRSIYLDKQNVTLDVNRFRPTLVKALELLHQ